MERIILVLDCVSCHEDLVTDDQVTITAFRCTECLSPLRMIKRIEIKEPKHDEDRIVINLSYGRGSRGTEGGS